MSGFALILTSALFGGMILFSFGFAPFVFKYLKPDAAGVLIRNAFPWYYRYVLIISALAAAAWITVDMLNAQILLGVALIGMIATFVLMPKINEARDEGPKKARMFKALHMVSVGLNFGQLGLCVWVLLRVV